MNKSRTQCPCTALRSDLNSWMFNIYFFDFALTKFLRTKITCFIEPYLLILWTVWDTSTLKWQLVIRPTIFLIFSKKMVTKKGILWVLGGNLGNVATSFITAVNYLYLLCCCYVPPSALSWLWYKICNVVAWYLLK